MRVSIGVLRPCLPGHYDIVTPRHLLPFSNLLISFVIQFVHFSPKFGSPFYDCEGRVDVKRQCGQTNETKPEIKCGGQIKDGNEDVDERWHDVEEYLKRGGEGPAR